LVVIQLIVLPVMLYVILKISCHPFIVLCVNC
jgi:hypothetical protein